MRYLTLLLLIGILFVGCEEEYVGQYPVDSVAPPCVTNPKVENLSGKVRISYTIPNETDILYVKAQYINSAGKLVDVKSSVFKNEMMISGFGKSKKQTIDLITVDRSQNESEPVSVEIEPLDSPIYGIIESMHIYESWGGAKFVWDNPEKEQIVVYVITKDEEGKDFNLETFYSEAAEGVGFVRGMESVPTPFNVVVKDSYNNFTDTLTQTVTPLYEMKLPSEKFKGMPLAPGYKISQWGQPLDCLWNGITGNDEKYYMDLVKPNPYFTVDLGAIYKLSRTKVWQRLSYAYRLHNPKIFELWGTSDPEAAADPANWKGWTLLMTCHSHKPSGENTTTITSEDKAYANMGEDFEFPVEAPAIRYIRFRSVETWTNSLGLHFSEWTLWGQEVNN